MQVAVATGMQEPRDLTDVTALFRELDRHPLLDGAARAVHRADGVTELVNGRGVVTGWLPTEDFEAIRPVARALTVG